jgi:hypothetical protein
MNIAEILKYCPEGTRLYSPIFGEVDFIRVLPLTNMIRVIPIKSPGVRQEFYEDGTFYDGGECVLFPSNSQRDWYRFRLPFKAGDIVMTKDGETPFIFKGYAGNIYAHCYCGVDIYNTFKIEYPVDTYWTNEFIIPASKEAKKKLFDKMAEARYIWYTDTLELEKVKLKFKPFDKVLVKNQTDEKWSINLFSYYDKENKIFPYVCLDGKYHYCVPYEGNEYILGTTINQV